MSIKRCIFLLTAGALLLTGCTAGRSSFSKAQKLELEGNYDEAVVHYAEAFAVNPQSSEYRLRFLKASEKGAQFHLERGEQFQIQNRYDEAFREFQAAAALDPGLERARQLATLVQRLKDGSQFRNEAEAFEKERKFKEALRSYQRALELNLDDYLAKEAIQRLLNARKTKLDGYELNLKSQQPITLKFKEAKLKDVFAIVTQLSGINFIFDEGFKDQNVTIHLEKATFNQAVEVLTGMYRLGRKVLNDSTVILYPKTPEKTKNYEDLVVRTFYLNRLDAKKAVNLLRTMIQLKKIYVNEENNALVIRDTPETIEVAEKILDANDVPDAEVLLEVEIIELSKKNQEKFGLALSRYAISGAFDHKGTILSDVLTAPTEASEKTATNLLKFDFGTPHGYFTIPNATFNFGKTLANGETLSNPKLRVKNREKAKFNVGTRIPITTTSSTGTTGGVAVNVQYVDVGVKLNAEPVIQLNNEISMKVSLEVSSLLSKEAVGSEGTTVATIGTRNLDTVLSLKDGETTIIGGLMQDVKSKSKTKIMFLGDIPVIGPLLSNNDDSIDKTELILAITPRLIKGMTLPEAGAERFWSGRDDEPSTVPPFGSFAEDVDFDATKVAPEVNGKPKDGASGLVPPVAQPKAGQMPSNITSQQVVPPSAPIATVTTEGKLSLSGPESAKRGQQFKMAVFVMGANNLQSAPFVLTFDPATTEFVSAEAGTLMTSDQQPFDLKTDVNKEEGTLAITLARSEGRGGVSGDGPLVTLTFRAKESGLAVIEFASSAFVDVAGNPLPFVGEGQVVNIE